MHQASGFATHDRIKGTFRQTMSIKNGEQTRRLLPLAESMSATRRELSLLCDNARAMVHTDLKMALARAANRLPPQEREQHRPRHVARETHTKKKDVLVKDVLIK